MRDSVRRELSALRDQFAEASELWRDVEASFALVDHGVDWERSGIPGWDDRLADHFFFSDGCWFENLWHHWSEFDDGFYGVMFRANSISKRSFAQAFDRFAKLSKLVCHVLDFDVCPKDRHDLWPHLSFWSRYIIAIANTDLNGSRLFTRETLRLRRNIDRSDTSKKYSSVWELSIDPFDASVAVIDFEARDSNSEIDDIIRSLPEVAAVAQIAKITELNPKTLASRLSRFAAKNPNCREEIDPSARRIRGPGARYIVASITPVLKQMLQRNRNSIAKTN
jgi:hypothetical protein